MALWNLLESKAASPAQAADATARSLAAGARAGLGGRGAVFAGDTVHQVVEGHYKRVIWVWRCVDAIAQAETSLPIYAWQSHDDESARADGFDHLERLLNGPDRVNKFEECREFRYRVSTLLLLSTRGVFVEVVRDKTTNDPAQLTILDSDAVEIIPDDTERVKAYRVRYAKNGIIQQRDLDPDRVLWLRSRPHPTDPYRQMTPLEAAGLSADTDYLARVFNKTWLGNDGRVSKLIALDPGESSMNPADLDALKAMFGGSGPARAGETRVVDAKQVSVADVGGSPADAQYKDLQQSTKTEIMEAFGVSEPFIAWAQGRTWDNASVELYSTWNGTMRWHCTAFASGFMQLVRAEGAQTGTAILAHDFSKVYELQRPGQEKADRAKAEFQAGLITIDEYREASGKDPWKVPGTQVLWTPAGGPIGHDDKTTEAAQALVAANRPPQPLAPGVGAPGGALPPGQDPNAPSAGDLQGLTRQLQSVVNERSAEGQGQKALVAARSRLGRTEHKTRRPRRKSRRSSDVVDAEVVDEWVESPAETATKDAETAIGRELAGVCRRMLGAVDGRLQSTKTRKGTRHWDPSEAEVKAGYAPSRQIIEYYVAQADRWSHQELETVRAIVRSAASGAMADLRPMLERDGLDGPGIMLASRLVQQLVNRLVGDVEKGMRKRVTAIQRLIRRMDDQGYSIDEIKQAVAEQQAALDDWTAKIAPRVAQAAVQGARKALIDRVPDSRGVAVWSALHDGRTRHTHIEADGQVAKRGQGWMVGGYRMAFPGDPRVPPAQWINCRCTTVYRRADGTQA